MKTIFVLSALTNFLLTSGVLLPAIAQVVTDGSTNTSVNTTGNNHNILNGIQKGNNLFHSFKEFSIPTGGSATFNNSTDVVNIINRVTGGNISNIDGLIKASGNANLFLINPAGIVFGENSRLDIGGSFLGSTAESILFKDGFNYSAIVSEETPLLTISVPEGLQMGTNPGRIEVNGTGNNLLINPMTGEIVRDFRPLGLQVDSGKTLALVGGDVLFQGGNLTANQGRIELGSVKSDNRVSINSVADGFSLDYKDVEQFGLLNFEKASSVEVSGEGSGNYQFQAGKISVVENSSILSNVLGSQNGGKAIINARESLEIIGNDTGFFPSSILNQTEPGSTGSSGDLSIETGKFTILNNALISNSINASGNGGTLNIKASDLTITATPNVIFPTAILSQVNPGATGKGGDIDITVRNINIAEGGFISSSTFGSGDAGNTSLKVTEKLTVQGSDTFSSSAIASESRPLNPVDGSSINSKSKGGNISIQARNIEVVEGGLISASTLGSGDAGNIDITVTENFKVNGYGSFSPSAITNRATELGSNGNGGNISINAKNMELSKHGIISATTLGSGNAGNVNLKVTDTLTIDGDTETSNFERSSISSTVGFLDFNGNSIGGSGNGGDININSANIKLLNSGLIVGSTYAEGNAGNINIDATNNIKVDDSLVSSFVHPNATGDGGEISIKSPILKLNNDSELDTSTAGKGNAGTIDLQVADLLELTNQSSIISNTFSIASGNGGDVKIKAGLFQINNSEIAAASDNSFAAGSIKIDAEKLNLIDNSNISVSGNSTGDAGNLFVNSREIKLDNQSSLQAQVAAGNQGKIFLNSDFLNLRRNSNITANATGTATGGNININSSVISGFENSDIIANAVEGNGGNIDIKTQGIFGLKYRDEITEASDITASSQFGINGTVEINNISIDPSSGLVELSAELADSSQQISTGCSSNAGSNFVATGRGGMPQNPDQYLYSGANWSDIRDLSTLSKNQNTNEITKIINKPEIVEATNFIRNSKGEIELVAIQNKPVKNHKIINCSGIISSNFK